MGREREHLGPVLPAQSLVGELRCLLSLWGGGGGGMTAGAAPARDPLPRYFSHINISSGSLEE